MDVDSTPLGSTGVPERSTAIYDLFSLSQSAGPPTSVDASMEDAQAAENGTPSLGSRQNALRMQLASIGLLAQPNEVQKQIMQVLNGEINEDITHLLVGGVTDELSGDLLKKALPFRINKKRNQATKRRNATRKRQKQAQYANALAERITGLDLDMNSASKSIDAALRPDVPQA